jgi:shikimate kinase
MKNIVLTGFMGTGKTEVGKMLAKRLGALFIDADSEIEKRAGKKIANIFSTQGEPAFRDMESETLRALSENDRTVISTGGGAVLRQENMDILRRKGVIVCLNASAKTILHRTRGCTDRPLLNVEDPLAKIKEMLAQRQPYYEKADIIIDTENKSPMQIADEIMEEMKAYEKGNG